MPRISRTGSSTSGSLPVDGFLRLTHGEILRRYGALRRSEMIDPAFAAILGIFDVVYPIERTDVERARRLLGSRPELSARDALHLAVMQGHDVGRIISFDGGLDGIPGIARIGT